MSSDPEALRRSLLGRTERWSFVDPGSEPWVTLSVSERDAIVAVLERAEQIEAAARRFHELWWKLQEGLNSFDLHNATVAEFEQSEREFRAALARLDEAAQDA